MSFLKSLTFPNGMELGYHKVMKIESAGDFSSVTFTVSSWKDEEQYLTGITPLWNSYEVKPVTLQLIDDITLALYSSGTFQGATLVSDSMDSLDTVKLRAWARIKNVRDEHEYSPVAFADTSFDADADSVRRIIGANSLTLIRQLAWVTESLSTLANHVGVTLSPVPTEGMQWTDANNTPVDLTLQQIQGLGLAVAAQVGAVHYVARGLRDAINSADSKEDANLVHWPTT